MDKVVGCILVALALGFIIVIDVMKSAPVWTVYMEWVGLFLAFLAAIMYYMYYRKKSQAEEDGQLDT